MGMHIAALQLPVLIHLIANTAHCALHLRLHCTYPQLAAPPRVWNK
jgi:hypothetical protein